MTQDQKAKLLVAHCQELALNRMRAATTEALGTAQGWNVALLHEWMAYNENVVLLLKTTRQLLPF